MIRDEEKRWLIVRIETLKPDAYEALINKSILREHTTPLQKDIDEGTYSSKTIIFYGRSDKLPKGYIYEFYYDESFDGLTLYKAHDEKIFDEFVANKNKEYNIQLSSDWDIKMHRGYDEFGNYNEFYADEKFEGLSKYNNLEFAKHYSECIKPEAIEPEIDIEL